MHRSFIEAVSRISELSEEQQAQAALLLLNFIDQKEVEFTPEQIAEIDHALEENDVATDAEVEAFFARLK